MLNRTPTKLFLAIATSIMFLFNTGCAGSSASASASSGHMTEHSNMGRTFLMYKPSSVPAGKKMPLLIVLHGGLGNANYISRKLGMNPVAEKYGFMVAYLNGTGGRRFMKKMRTWNAGGGCCGPASKMGVD